MQPIGAVRYVIATAVVILLVGVLAALKGAQLTKLIEQGKEAERAGPPPEAVGTFRVEQQTWPISIDAVGSVTSAKGVSIRNEVPGIVTRLPIRSGARVRKGQVLVELDTDIERAALASAIAALELARTNVTRLRPLAAEGAAPRAQLDQAEADLEVAAARVDELRAQIDQKVVRAPFSGRLGIRLVDLGQFLEAGTPITVLETADALLVDFTLPQKRLGEVAVGMPVKVVVGVASEPLSGVVAAVAPAVDADTRSVSVRARVTDEQGRLRRGMFVNVEVILGKRQLLVIPGTAIVHASYGDSVFVVTDKRPDEPGARETPDGAPIRAARQRFVKTGPERGDYVAVLEGVRVGDDVVSAGAFKLRDNAPVVVTEKAVPVPELTPRPPNR